MIHAKDEKNQDIDWWFMYKLPIKVGSPLNKGFQYLYYGDGSQQLELSDNDLTTGGALYNTLNDIFNCKDEGHGYIVYNDERTDGGDNNGGKGHCKGILVFNKTANTGMILCHSTPRFPKKGELGLPEEEAKFGQTYICITLPDFNTVTQIAQQMLKQHNPQVLTVNSQLPSNIDASDALYDLYHQEGVNEMANPSTINFKSKGGKDFSLIAKSKKWGKDYWVQLVSEQLDVNLEVESWIRGAVAKSQDPGVTEEDQDVVKIDLTPLGYKDYYWEETQDHAKWGVATPVKGKEGNHDYWICVADINRMASQAKRGGGGICFKEPALWTALDKIIAQAKTN